MPFDSAVVATTFAVLLVAELGDKTQIAALALSARSRTFGCFLGSVLGFVLANLLMVPLGCVICSILPAGTLTVVGGLLMVVSGALVLMEKEEKTARTFKGGIFAQALATIFLLELGDKTNLATLAIVTSTGAVLEALIGLTLAALVLMGIASTLGSLLTRVLSSNRVKVLSASLMIGVGVVMLLKALTQSFS